MEFIGRNEELKSLSRLQKKDTASLVIVRGRRRIGKSTLIQHFSSKYRNFIEIQGLSPNQDKNSNNKQLQLDHFSEKLSLKFNERTLPLSSWEEAFHHLSEKTKKGEWLILLDEISWMATDDNLFSAKLKEAWDTKFKKNNKLMLVVCGSVTSWIEKEIVSNLAFEGRISLDLKIEDLLLNEINQFWTKKKINMGTFEKMILLSITGGVPKYLEEILLKDTAENNIIEICFKKSGFLYNEFDKIFREIFLRKTNTMEKIIRLCLNQRLSPAELAKKMKTSLNSDFSENIKILELAGFLTRDYVFKPDGRLSKLNYLRIKDNYLRFYLKYIEPNKIKIEKNASSITKLSDLKNLESLIGYQFENLLLANRKKIISQLGLSESDVISCSPYTQKKNTKVKKGCQIDLLIHTKLDVFYLCEFKCRRKIDASVITEVKEKVKNLKLPKRSSLQPVFIYEGEVSLNDLDKINDYFYQVISFSEMLG